MTSTDIGKTLSHSIVSLGPPRPLPTTTISCTNTIDSSGNGSGCVSTPACESPLVISTDLNTSLYGGVPLLICVPSTSGSIQSSSPSSSAAMTTINPGGPIMSLTGTPSASSVISATSPSGPISTQPGGSVLSSVTSGISPTGNTSFPLRHTSLTEPLSTASASSTPGTGTSALASSSPTSSAARMNANCYEPSLVVFVMLCWMGISGWRTLRERL